MLKNCTTFLLSLSIILLAFPSLSQHTRSYALHIGGEAVKLQAPVESWERLKVDPTTLHGGALYLLIQLNEIPSETEKSQLAKRGVQLLNYIPNYAWVAKMNPSLSVQDLDAMSIIGLCRMEAKWKVPSEMWELEDNNTIEVRVLFWKDGSVRTYEEILVGFDITVLSTDDYAMNAQIELAELRSLAASPLVQYIEWPASEPIYEGLLDETERAISTYISNNPGKGYYYDGSGVTIGVDEGGAVDTLENPNFRSRIIRTYEGTLTPSGHKTGVALRMAGAGNIDPKEQGTAYGAEIYSGGLSTTLAPGYGVKIVNRSYGWGCPSGATTYSSASVEYDNVARLNPTFTITHSAGNDGGGLCYAGSAGWGNITGLPKMAKNIFIVGASDANGVLAGFSSRGPAKDGRLLPNVVSPGGGGTSHASPNLAGVYAQLSHAYQTFNGSVPAAGLLKALIMNTADDMENPGPDFKTGFGSINARRAYQCIENNQFITGSMAQGGMNNHTIAVPANVKEVRTMLYWTDWEATAGISSKALVNDLDLLLMVPGGQSYQPWVLNPTFDPIFLNAPAVRALDTLNNMEQVTLDNPVPGSYTIRVDGALVPQGPQTYFIAYEFVFDEIVITHPHGGERLVPNQVERIRWDACDSNLNFNLSYSLDNGTSWSSLATGLAATARYYDWTVPNAVTKQALVRVQRGSTQGISDTTFTIYAQIQNLTHVWACADSSLFSWDVLAGADGYVVHRIVGDYMDSVDYTSSNSIVLNGLSLTESEYISVSAVSNTVMSRRVVALEREPSDFDCILNDVGVSAIVNPGAAVLPSCMASGNIEITVSNFGVNALSAIPVAYQIDATPVQRDTVYTSVASGEEINFTFLPNFVLSAGQHTLTAWTELPADTIQSNDTLTSSVFVFNSSSATPNAMQTFDNFTNCSTGWGCEQDVCALEEGWYNAANLSGDEIDWRTNEFATGTASTGPSGDHTSGNGKYLYLEGSGNGGSGCLNKTALLYSPCFDLTNVSTAELSFWYHAYGSGIGELHVDLLTNGTLIEDITAPVIGAQGDLWIESVVDLSSYTGNQVVVIIRGSTGGGYYSDLAIDDINISALPSIDFQAIEQVLCVNQSTTIDNFSALANSYQWTIEPATHSFVNGTNASSVEPQVQFNAGGWYAIELYAANAFGADSLVQTDHVYVWSTAPALSAQASYCIGDSVIVQGNNAGLPVEYFLNNVLIQSGSEASCYFPTAQDGDLIHAVYAVNATCSLYSDTMTVNVTTVLNTVTQTANTLYAENLSATSYQWIDCMNGNQAISGATNSSFSPLQDGQYAVIVSENGCTDTSACFVYSTAGMAELTDMDWSVYPNPTSGQVSIEFTELVEGTIELLGVDGKRIAMCPIGLQKIVQIQINEAPGIYLLRVQSEDGLSRTMRLVKSESF